MLSAFFSQFDLLEIIGMIILGYITGMAAGFFGIGGGIIIVPCLLLMHFPIQHAIGISIVQMVFASTFGSFISYKKRLFDIRDGVFIGIGGLFGASFSGLVLSVCSEFVLSLAFLAISIFSLYKFARKKNVQGRQEIIMPLWKKRAILVLAGAFTGVFAISLGIGGGLLIAPILGHYLGYDSKKVVPLSLFFVVFSSISGCLSLHQMDVVDTQLFIAGTLIGCMSILGVATGIKLIAAASARTHRIALLWIYCFAIIATSIKIIEKTL